MLLALLGAASLFGAAALAAPGSPSLVQSAQVNEAQVLLAGPLHSCGVRWSVGPDGEPTDVSLTSCPGSLRAPVVEAAMAWRFEPLSTGTSFAYEGRVPVVPQPLDLPRAPSQQLEAPADWQTDPTPRRIKDPKIPYALEKHLSDNERRFAWEPCSVQVRVDAAGRVSSTAPVDCPALLWPNADKAARKARFDPATAGGKPVASLAELQLVFAVMP